MVSPLDIIGQLKGQITRLPSKDLVALVHGIGAIVEAQPTPLSGGKLQTLDAIMASAGRNIAAPSLDQFARLALQVRHDLVSFVATLIERSDPICATLAAHGHTPLTYLELARAIEAAAPGSLPGIAARHDLDGACVERLILRGDTAATRRVARNLFAPLFEHCQLTLAEMARTDEAIRMAMFCRPRLATTIGEMLLDMARDGDLIDPGTSLQRLPLAPDQRAEIQLLLELYHRTRKNTVDPLSREELREIRQKQRISFDEQMVMMLASGHFIDASDILAEELKITSGTMITSFSRGDDYEIAAICNHLALSPGVFAAFAQESDRRHKRPTRPLNKLVMLYTGMQRPRFKALILALGTRVPSRLEQRLAS